MNSARVSHAFASNLAVDLFLSPAAQGLANGDSALAFAGNAVVSYDTRAFKVGLGLGGSTINEHAGDIQSGSSHWDRAGVTIAQLARLGAGDGLHLEVVNSFVLADGQFAYGGTEVSLQSPAAIVSSTVWLVARGGGGTAGFGFGEVGLRVLTVGNGGAGSLFLTPTIGGATVWQEVQSSCDASGSIATGYNGDCYRTVNFAGPMVGFGVESRF